MSVICATTPRLIKIGEVGKPPFTQDKILCTRCGSVFVGDAEKCPYCGKKEDKNV